MAELVKNSESNRKILSYAAFFGVGIISIIAGGLAGYFSRVLLEQISVIIAALAALIFLSVFSRNIKTGFLLAILFRASADLFSETSIAGLNLSSLLAMVIILGGVLYFLGNNPKISSLPQTKYLLGLLFLFIVSIVASSNFTPDYFESFQEILRFSSFLVIYILAFHLIRTKEDVNKVLTIFFLSLIAPFTMALYQFVFNRGATMTAGYSRVMGTFVHPNQFAYYLLLAIILAIFVFFESNSSNTKGLMVLIGSVASAFLFITYTRGAWITAVFIVIAFGVLKYRKIFIYIIPAVLVLLLLLPTIQERFSDLLGSDVTGSQSENSIEARLNIWRDTFPLFLKSPIIGVGWGTAKVITFRPTHNDLVRFLAETGILGVLLYLLMFLSLLRLSWRTYRQSADPYLSGLALSFFILTMAYFFLSLDSNLIRNIALQWVFWALAAIVYRISVLETSNFKETT